MVQTPSRVAEEVTALTCSMVREETNCMRLRGLEGWGSCKTTNKRRILVESRNRFKRGRFGTCLFGEGCVRTHTYTPQMCTGGFGARQVCVSPTHLDVT